MKKILSVFLCFVLIFSIVCFSFSYAADNSDNKYAMFSSLTDNQKAVYLAVKDNPLAYNVSGSYPYPNAINITLPVPLEYTAGYSGPTDDSDSDALEIIAAGLYAFAYDFPQYFWFSGFAQNTVCTSELLDNGITYKTTVTGYTVYPLCKSSSFSSKQDLIDKTEEMINTVNLIKISGYSRYEKVKSIHNAVCSLASYNTNTNTYPSNRIPHGLFLEPHIAVCESYATAFKMLCDRENIPCVVVIGKYANGGHAWNYVEMDDGNLYAVDCTFDDSDNGIDYYYFLSAANSPDFRSTTGETFSQTHINDGKLSFFDTFNFTYTEFCETPYANFYLGTDSKSIYIKEKQFLVIPANSTVDTQVRAPDNNFFMAFSNATGTSVNLMNFSTMAQSYCFTLVMRGDVIPDETVDETDLNEVLKATVGTRKFTADEDAQFTAGDINGDGVIDGFDVAKLDLIIYSGQ